MPRYSISRLIGPAAALLLAAAPLRAQATAPSPADPGWPRHFLSGADSITIYQPQVDAWTNNLLTFHAAVGYKTPAMQQPTYGAINVQAATGVDKDTRLVDLYDIAVTSGRFPAAGADSSAFLANVTLALPSSASNISLDRLETSLAVSQEQQAVRTSPVQNTPPRIIFSDQQSFLVLIDGAPQYVAVTGQPLTRVVNTLVFLVRDQSGVYWLHVYDGYLSATSLQGPWVVAKAPSSVQKAAQAAAKAGQVDMLTGAAPNDSGPKPTLKNTTPPAIFVETSPTELVVTSGPPAWAGIPGTSLQYISNTRGDVFQDTDNDQYYVLLSGRWFTAPGRTGPWVFVPSDQLPTSFGQIPFDSPKENVLASIPGTTQAEEAVIENQVPQTATVYRDSASFTSPAFGSGGPHLAAIEGTSLSYVTNSAVPIIEVAPTSWYALQSGVWFAAPAVTGPWTVATSVPAVMYSIPPSSSIYYVTFVQVYGSTSSVVYVGYTPGYYGAVVTPQGTVVYGTGYSYPVTVVNNVYYPAPTTYGYGATMSYNPYAGWAFMFAAGYAVGHSSYYAPYPYYGYAYHPDYGGAYGAAYGAYGGAAAWGPGGYAATTGNVYHQYGATSAVSRSSGGYNAWTGNAYGHQGEQSYNSMTGTSTAAERSGYANAYTGNYATQGAGAAYNNQTGAAAAGVHTTQGNAYTGQQVSATKGVAYNPSTGQAESVGAMGSDGNYVAHAGNNVYAEKDGQTYSSTADGWKQPSSSGGWQDANMSGVQQDQFNAQSNARGAGDTRSAASGNFNRGYGGGGGGFGGGGFRGRR